MYFVHTVHVHYYPHTYGCPYYAVNSADINNIVVHGADNIPPSTINKVYEQKITLHPAGRTITLLIKVHWNVHYCDKDHSQLPSLYLLP